MRSAAAIALATVTLCACDSSGEDPRPQRPDRAAAHERAVRGWSRELNAGRYQRAADFFIRGVIVDQGVSRQLITRAQIVECNRSLPCRADVTRVVEERLYTLASFRLKRGPGGPCHGTVRVRFAIRGGKFSQFLQLPGQTAPPGDPA
jgi:hypothetical protein